MTLHQKLLSAIVEHDRRAEKRPGFNPYALPQYLLALERAEVNIALGDPIRKSLVRSFCGRLLDKMLKAAGEPISTREEQRF